MHTNNEEKYQRQVIAFGKEGQRKIEKVRVGIVGLGGMGSIIAQQLAYLGVHDYILVDDDLVETTNLNRLVGAFQDDAANCEPKVSVAARMVETINPNAVVERLEVSLRSEEALTQLSTKPTHLFGCVDNDGARLIISELAAAYELPLIDCATGIIPGQRHFTEFGGRVVVALPGEFCLLCAREIDLAIAKAELESPEEKNDRDVHGYGLGPTEPDPAVICLNAIIASLGIIEFMMLVTGMRKPKHKLTYRGNWGIVNRSVDERQQGCYICGYVVGKRDKVDIKRYVRRSLPEDLPH